MNPTDIAILSGARTPMGRYCEKLRDFTAMELGAIAGKEAIKRAGVDSKEVDHAVVGNAQQPTVGPSRQSLRPPFQRAHKSCLDGVFDHFQVPAAKPPCQRRDQPRSVLAGR